MQRIVRCALKSFEDMQEHDGIEYAGYLAFLNMLSIFPTIIFIIMLLNVMHQSNPVSIQHFFNKILTDAGALSFMNSILPRITEIVMHPQRSTINVAIISSVWTASATIDGMRIILNRAYRVRVMPKYFLRRILSIVHFLFIVIVIAIAFMAVTFLPIILIKIHKITSLEFGGEFVLQYSLVWLIILCALTWVHVLLTHKSQKIVYCIPGAIITMALWFLFTTCLRIYLLNFSNMNMIYGSLEGIIVTMLFFYFTNMCFIYGAEFNYNFSKIFLEGK